MDDLQLRDEAVKDRVRAATEFLDPSMLTPFPPPPYANRPQLIEMLPEATDQRSY
jgi:hypothetical protein